MTALEMQWEHLDLARKYAEDRGLDAVGGAGGRRGDPAAAGRRSCTGLETDPMTLASQLDWVAKYRIIDGYRERHGLGWRDPAWRPWTCSTTTCDPERSLLRPARRWSGCSIRRGRGVGHDRAAARRPAPISEVSACSGGRRPSPPPTGTRWCSTSAHDPLRRVPMMEPLRGTTGHVDELLDGACPARPSCSSDWAREAGEARPWQNVNRSRSKRPPGPRKRAIEEVPAASTKGEELKAELDDLLDEIDEVLEENAEEFVRSYVQKGGE